MMADAVAPKECQPLLGNTYDSTTTAAPTEGGSNDEELAAGLSKDETTTTIVADAMDILKIGIPIFISSISWVGKKTTDTALLGHLSSPDALAASALSDLWTMTTSVLLTGRILQVLIGGAVGAGNPRLGGIYLQVSYVVLFSISIVVIVAWNCTEYVWHTLLGRDPLISKMAGDYARTLSFAIPATILFGQLSQFFSAQQIMYPEVKASTIGLTTNLVFGLVFVLGWPIPNFQGYGFNACPIVTVVTTYIQLIFLVFVYIYCLQLHTACWPVQGFQWKEITWTRIRTFSELYFPAALSSASDFWRVGVIGIIAAELGEPQVAIFNTAYRIMWIALIFVSAIVGAASIEMNIRFGRMDPYGAKQVLYSRIEKIEDDRSYGMILYIYCFYS